MSDILTILAIIAVKKDSGCSSDMCCNRSAYGGSRCVAENVVMRKNTAVKR